MNTARRSNRDDENEKARAVLGALSAAGRKGVRLAHGDSGLKDLVTRLAGAIGASGAAAISLANSRTPRGAGKRWGVLIARLGPDRGALNSPKRPKPASSTPRSPVDWLSARFEESSSFREEWPPISPSDLGLPARLGPFEALVGVRVAEGAEPVVLLFVGEGSALGQDTLALLSPLAAIVPHLVHGSDPSPPPKRPRQISQIRPVGFHRQEIEPTAGNDGSEDDRLRFLGAMAAGIAHDFGNLATTMLGTSVLLEEQLEDAPEELRTDAASLTAVARRATSLVHDLLRLSRGGSPWDGVADLDAVVEGTTELLGRVLGARFDLRVRAGSRATVPLAAHQVERLITNLALNARDAMGEAGTITLSTFRLEPGRARAKRLGLESGRAYAVLRVEDAGPGMSGEVLKRAADPFFTTKAGSGGTGLGLATCSLLATRAGGGLIIESEEGEGTRVEVWLAIRETDPRG